MRRARFGRSLHERPTPLVASQLRRPYAVSLEVPRMKMVASTLVLVIAALTLSACGGEGSASGSAKPAAAGSGTAAAKPAGTGTGTGGW